MFTRAAIVLLVSTTLSVAQESTRNGGTDDKPTEPEAVVEFAERYNQRFAIAEPLVGDAAPEVDVFDEAGEPFDWSRTRGKHTVIVFGCLT